VATGDHDHGTVATVDPAELPEGAVVTGSGRVSAAEVFAEPDTTGLLFAIDLGDLGANAEARAAELQSTLDNPDTAVLAAVDPGARKVEIVTGAEARLRLPDRGAKLAVMSMVASFKEGDLFGGLLSGLRMLADQAGHRR
jgi:hypothetical protein